MPECLSRRPRRKPRHRPVQRRRRLRRRLMMSLGRSRCVRVGVCVCVCLNVYIVCVSDRERVCERVRERERERECVCVKHVCVCVCVCMTHMQRVWTVDGNGEHTSSWTVTYDCKSRGGTRHCAGSHALISRQGQMLNGAPSPPTVRPPAAAGYYRTALMSQGPWLISAVL